MRLISVEKDWKHLLIQKVVTLHTCRDIACLTFQLPHITTGSFQSHRRQPTTGSLHSLQRLKERNKPSVRWKSFAIHKLVWWHLQAEWESGLQFVLPVYRPWTGLNFAYSVEFCLEHALALAACGWATEWSDNTAAAAGGGGAAGSLLQHHHRHVFSPHSHHFQSPHAGVLFRCQYKQRLVGLRAIPSAGELVCLLA